MNFFVIDEVDLPFFAAQIALDQFFTVGRAKPPLKNFQKFLDKRVILIDRFFGGASTGEEIDRQHPPADRPALLGCPRYPAAETRSDLGDQIGFDSIFLCYSEEDALSSIIAAFE
jgi:hypothetical protein